MTSLDNFDFSLIENGLFENPIKSNNNTYISKLENNIDIILPKSKIFRKDNKFIYSFSLDDSKFINSRLVERGPPHGLPTMKGAHGIERNFGNNYDDYNEKSFLEMAEQIKSERLLEKGLYMPMIIKKEHLEFINYYPEGNITVNNFRELQKCDKNDMKQFKYIYATEDDVYKKKIGCIPGDKVLTHNLAKIGVHHYTAMDSIVYHFQQGEKKE